MSGQRCCATTARSGSTWCTGTRRRFERVSWAFVDAYVDQTLADRGWWRELRRSAAGDRAGVLEGRPAHPRALAGPRGCPPTSSPATRAARWSADAGEKGRGHPHLVDGQRLEVDHVVFASGYRADLGRVPYLAGVVDRVSVTDGFPDLSPGFETSCPGSSSPASPRPATSGRSTASPRAARPRPRISVAEMLRWLAPEKKKKKKKKKKKTLNWAAPRPRLEFSGCLGEGNLHSRRP